MRLFVLGAPCAGKSTVAACLRQRGVDVLDADDEILRLNAGVWPDIETKNERLLPTVLDRAAAKTEVVLFNSYMPLHRTRQLRDQGFTVALLEVAEAELRRRDRARQEAEGWSNAEWFEWHQQVIRDHHDAGLIDVIIDGAGEPEEIAAELLVHLRQRQGH